MGGVVELWPEHLPFLERSFAGRTDELLEVSDALAKAAIALTSDSDTGLEAFCEDYKFMCQDIVLPEELYFRRHGSYRAKTFEEANRECYSNGAFMARYMNGLLVSNVMWSNHAQAFSAFVNGYLPSLKPGSRHLEIGPGHGLFLQYAAQSSQVASLTGWDVSPTSIESTRHALSVLGVTKTVDLRLQDLFEVGSPPPGEGFDSVVMSEILEHVEDPYAALRAAAEWLRPGGKIWINVPANSPAPDHIYLFTGLEHAAAMTEACGLTVVDQAAFPMSGATLAQVIKRKQTISCVITAVKPS
ncbi:MAG: class I SAM-dependent methyltransferase [Janthinobacterium lividum]